MPAAGVLPSGALWVLMAVRPFWPDALEIDLHAAADAPGPERLRAIEMIAAKAGDAAMPILRPLLADPDPGVRLYATRSLIRAGESAGAEAAAARIIAPGAPPFDRQLGLELLREAVTLPASARTVAERALHDAEPGVRAAAIEVLRRHGAGAALPAILAAFDDDNREVRLRAVRLVAASRDPRAAAALLGALDDGDRQVRIEAVRGLAGHPRALPALVRVAEGVAGEPGPADELRAAAVDSLGALKAEGAVSLLSDLARRRPADELARHALLALGQIATPEAIATLVSLAGTPPVLDETRLALRSAGGAAVPALLRAIERGREAPTGAAISVELLGAIGDRRATAPLASAVDRRPELAPLAIVALRTLGDPAAVPALVRAAESPSVELRRRAVGALLALRDPRGVAVVARGLDDPDPQVRADAVRLAAALAVRAVLPSLGARLADPDPTVRVAAAGALTTLGAAGTTGAALAKDVLAGLKRPDAPVRDDDEWWTVGGALARLVGTREAPLLDAAAQTAAGPRRIAIARALAAVHERTPITDGAVTARLLEAVREKGTVARAAADALANARLRDDRALRIAFNAASPQLRARLCPAVAATARGGDWLAALIVAGDEPVSVRAAAAWAARGLPDARDALRAAATGAADDPIAANARAALAVEQHGDKTAWADLRLQLPDGMPWNDRWLTVSGTNGLTVWIATDDAGTVHLGGLPEGALAVQAVDPGRFALASLR
jgi:HEAT repeat protein